MDSPFLVLRAQPAACREASPCRAEGEPPSRAQRAAPT